ncbi:MAG: Gfo/Idh/MocA family oxidoreductase [Planctomycetia bacterium]|nr:Gfo/Idh/MocA family oxidoreductase [Planctomycetia bacterium]
MTRPRVSRPVSAAALPRRGFLAATSAVSAGYWIAPETKAADGTSSSANEEIRFACIGIGGKGASDAGEAARHGKIVAVADVDANQLKRATTAYEGAKQYADFRRMLDEMGKEFDAVTVSTPDHLHITAAGMALGKGKHCFCQKPLTRTLGEARLLGELARSQKVATQMGNQGTSSGGVRKLAAFIKGGGLGTVKEVHIWTNRPVWPQGGGRPAEKPVPENLSWDLWLGPAPVRPFGPGYHPFAWRGFWDFGSGALGDMACHTMNMPFMALDLRNPATVQATTSGHTKETFPKWSVIDYTFPALGSRPALTMKWYDGGKLPDLGMFAGLPGEVRKDKEGKEEQLPFQLANRGVLVIGDKEKLYASGDACDSGGMLTTGRVPDNVKFERSPGHFAELVRAIRGGPQAVSNFPDYAGPLTETGLVGNLAIWLAATADEPGKKLDWDPVALVARNASELEPLIRPTYRDGWKI